MSPSAEKVQCPFCMGHPRVKKDGTMYAHDRGRPGVRKLCPGAGKTKEEAKTARLAADRETTVPSGAEERVDPWGEDLPF